MSDGRLTGAELEAIRERAEHGWPIGQPVYDDVGSLLAHADALAADLAAAEGALFDLTSPQSGEANAAYLRGVEDGVRRAAGVIRQDKARLLARVETSDDPVARRWFAWVAGNLDALAAEVESPPAPAAAPGGG